MAHEENPSKQARGRPKGPSKEDSATLRKIAELICKNPHIKPTKAMRQILERPDEKTLHRLNFHWRRLRAELLDEVNRRRQHELEERARSRSTVNYRALEIAPGGTVFAAANSILKGALGSVLANRPAMAAMAAILNASKSGMNLRGLSVPKGAAKQAEIMARIARTNYLHLFR